MKVVILAGGFGTRLSEYTEEIPKPMVMIGSKPILWHVMSCYANHGFKEFVVALGYKAEVIKDYFLNYSSLSNDFTVDLSDGDISVHSKNENIDWKVTLVDTGLNSMTGGRVKRLEEFLKDETFMLTYGDGLCNVNINELLEYHKDKKRLVTLCAVRPPARFGNLELTKDGLVKSFTEKSQLQSGRINGGFFVMEPEFLEYLDNDLTILEKEPLEKAAINGQVAYFEHDGFWQCMDTKRDKDYLSELIDENTPPWLE